MTKQELHNIIINTLQPLGLHDKNSEALIMGICATETDFGKYRRQKGFAKKSLRQGGLGIYQIEAATMDDILYNYLLPRKHNLYTPVLNLCTSNMCNEENLISNDIFATAICRCFFLRFKESIPDANDVEDLARYWKRYYNTEKGKGTTEDFVTKYHKYVLEEKL